MNKLTVVKVKKLHPNAVVPQRMTPGAAGADLYACLDNEVILGPGQRVLIPTGLSLEIPPLCLGHVQPRSGLAAKFGITVANSPGLVDEDYRGELKVILVNHGTSEFTISNGDRIAQFVIQQYVPVFYEEEEELSETERGTGGFGSTGR